MGWQRWGKGGQGTEAAAPGALLPPSHCTVGFSRRTPGEPGTAWLAASDLNARMSEWNCKLPKKKKGMDSQWPLVSFNRLGR